MIFFFICVVVICGFIDGTCKMMQAKNTHVSEKKASFGHHYQRDTIFHDVLGL